MIKDKFKFNLWLVFVLLQIYLVYNVILQHNYRFIIVQTAVTLLLYAIYLLRERLNLSNVSYSIIIFGFSMHFVGSVFRFYYQSPIILPYDRVIHTIIISGFTILFFNFIKKYFDEKRFNLNNFLLLLVILLTVNGIGVMGEISEYGAYVIYGLKEGALLFGGADYDRITVTEEVVSYLEMHVGGWYDTMDDLLFNLYSSLITIIILFLKFLRYDTS